MELTNQQVSGLLTAVKRYRDKERYTVISGFAGVGKSTLVSSIIDTLGLKKSQVCFACYTGKAAEVLRKKGNDNVTTLHKLLYESFPKPDGTFYRRKKPTLPYNIVVVDECSMVPMEMVEQLMTYRNVHTIYLGDPFQIPPIDTGADNHLLDNPHCFLSEVMRQAKESEIVRASMDIRDGKTLQLCNGSELQVFNRKDVGSEILLEANQIIVATNKTRKAINNTVRKMLKLTPEPQFGDKLICCRNYWDVCSDEDSPLINGSIVYLQDYFNSFEPLPPWAGKNRNLYYLCANLKSDVGEYYKTLKIDKNLIMHGEKSLDRNLEYKLYKNKMYKFMIPLEFEYGYAITCHRAQGSEWDSVLVVEESFPFTKEEHARWLYTAITRASSKCIVVKK